MIGGEDVTKIDLPFLSRQRGYKGRWVYYVRRAGKRKVRIRGVPGSGKFLEEYQAALGSPAHKPVAQTWRWLCQLYMDSPEFGELARPTRRQRELVLQSTWGELREPGAAEVFGDCPLAYFTARAVRVLRDWKRDHPEAANHRVKAIRAVFKWAIEARHVEGGNPARDIPGLRPKNPTGHHTWTVAQVRQYERRHPVGTKARLALALFMFTGARISDVARFGQPMAQSGSLCWTEAKNAGHAPKERVIPLLPELLAVLHATTLTGRDTWLVTQYGRPFSVKGLGQWFRDRCDEAGLPKCSAHGLRKAAATIAAENGATNAQLKAIFAWLTDKQVALYTRAADEKRLAAGAMPLVVSKE